MPDAGKRPKYILSIQMEDQRASEIMYPLIRLALELEGQGHFGTCRIRPLDESLKNLGPWFIVIFGDTQLPVSVEIGILSMLVGGVPTALPQEGLEIIGKLRDTYHVLDPERHSHHYEEGLVVALMA